MSRCRRYIISGRVQGVFYRQTTVDYAGALGLSGWAKNMVDGRVEVLACGQAQELHALEKWLSQGPPLASVQAVQAMDAEDEDCRGFVIRY